MSRFRQSVALLTMFFAVETREGHSGRVLIHESFVLRDLDVRHICIHRRECRLVPGESLQSVWVAHWRPHRWSVGHQQLHYLQQSLVLTGSFHATRLRHWTKVYINHVSAAHTGWVKQTWPFLIVDNFAMVSVRKECDISKVCKFCLEKGVKLA